MLWLVVILVVWVSSIFFTKRRNPKERRSLVVLGSGGHTTEMLSLLGALDGKFAMVDFVMASSDLGSEAKIKTIPVC